MKRENPSWGAPRIHGELLLLGFDISEPTVSRYLQRLKRLPDKSKASQWRAFLNNHREAIAAFDFFTVPNLYFRTLYCFFVIEQPAAAFCTSTLRCIQPAIGSCNNYAKHSRCRDLIGTSCLTMIPSSGMRCCSS